MEIAVQRIGNGRFERSILLTGLRGVGKTVLLNEFGSFALHSGWLHQHLEVTDDVRVAKAMAVLIRRTLLELSLKERSKARAQRALGALRSFVKVHIPAGDMGSMTIDFEPSPGTADSGELDVDLGALFAELGYTAKDAGVGILFTIDEMQYLSRNDFGALIVGLHRVSQLALPILVAGAGLPSLPGLAGEARSYAERLFNFVTIGSLPDSDARSALEDPVRDEGAAWDDTALHLIIAKTKGYPYFLQEFGKQAWNLADDDFISVSVVNDAIRLATDDLDQGFFRARVDKTTDAERDYLRAMATFGAGPYRSGEIADALRKKTAQTGPVRDSLIKRGLCYAPRHGELAFTVPMFDAYIRRAI